MKYIGVTSQEINGNFVCFITLGEWFINKHFIF
jgi:hypothetical protein